MGKWSVLGMVVAAMMLIGCSRHSDADDYDTVSQSTKVASVSRSATVDPDKAVKVSVFTAIEQFHDYFGADNDITSIDIEQVGQHYEYQLEGLSDSHEYELTLNARTGAIIEHKQEQLDADDANGHERQEDALETDNLQTLAHITSEAGKGLKSATAYKWSLEKDDGAAVWEVSFRHTDGERSVVQVNALTGTVLQAVTHSESNDDDD